MPTFSPAEALVLHNLGREATRLSDSIPGSAVELYQELAAQVSGFTKAGFLGLHVANPGAIMDREDLAAATITGNEMIAGQQVIRALAPEVLTLAQVALLATNKDEFVVEDIENVLLPTTPAVRLEIIKRIQTFADDLRQTKDRVLAIFEQVDDMVAEGLGLTSAEHETIRQRCREFPLSVTVERPRFAWSADRKRQARRTYRPGERFL